MDESPVRLEVQSWVIVGVAEEPNESEEHDEPDMRTCHSIAKSTCGTARYAGREEDGAGKVLSGP